MEYRRAYCRGGCYFFTVVTAGRRPILTKPGSIPVLRDAFRQVRARYLFTIEAIVVLPDHIHCVWTLPDNDDDFSTRWRLIKTRFSKRIRAPHRIWQPRFWEHRIRDETDYARHLDYIHYNPVKHEYVAAAADWPYSSFNYCVQQGLYPPDWGVIEPDIPAHVGKE